MPVFARIRGVLTLTVFVLLSWVFLDNYTRYVYPALRDPLNGSTNATGQHLDALETIPDTVSNALQEEARRKIWTCQISATTVGLKMSYV
jgi:hypothetical protein